MNSDAIAIAKSDALKPTSDPSTQTSIVLGAATPLEYGDMKIFSQIIEFFLLEIYECYTFFKIENDFSNMKIVSRFIRTAWTMNSLR
jgi:hypothetical protein